MTPVEDAGFAALARRLQERAGFTLDVYKDKCIRRRIAVRMRACGVHTYADYQAVLDQTPDELERLTDALTINVTRFYRNAETWNLIASDILPVLCAPERSELRAWSAGCSSGEEAYTLAVLAAAEYDRQGHGERLDRLSVDATDIDRQSLDRAGVAQYHPDTLAELPGDLTTRYFEHLSSRHPSPATLGQDDVYQVAERVRRQVRVRRHDLSRDPPPRQQYHLILCRNVVIYFDRTTQERLFLAFAEALAPGGYLVLGKVETLVGPARDRLTLLDPRERVFRRPASA